MRTPKLGILLAAILVGTAFLSLAPTASAQQSGSLTITLNTPSEAVKPLQAPLTVSGTATLVGDGAAYTGLIGVPVTFTATGPAWASIIVSPSTAVFNVQGTPSQTYTSSIPITVTITASQDAPAFTAAPVEVSGVTTAPNPTSKAIAGKGTTTITADYYSILDVQLAESIRVERPQTAVSFPLKVTNFGNANTKVAFEITQQAEGFQAAPPIPVTLQSKQAGGNQISADVPLTIQTPYKNGYMNEVGVIAYKITSNYALDAKKKGDESAVSVLITTRGFYVPGPSPILFLGLLGVAALLLRRRE